MHTQTQTKNACKNENAKKGRSWSEKSIYFHLQNETNRRNEEMKKLSTKYMIYDKWMIGFELQFVHFVDFVWQVILSVRLAIFLFNFRNSEEEIELFRQKEKKSFKKYIDKKNHKTFTKTFYSNYIGSNAMLTFFLHSIEI